MTTVFFVSLILSTFLCALVTGFVFTYAVVVMPGLKQLSDKEFIRAFQVTDAIIQNNHPFFMMVWLGSIISVSVAIVGIHGLDTYRQLAGHRNGWLLLPFGSSRAYNFSFICR